MWRGCTGHERPAFSRAWDFSGPGAGHRGAGHAGEHVDERVRGGPSRPPTASKTIAGFPLGLLNGARPTGMGAWSGSPSPNGARDGPGCRGARARHRGGSRRRSRRKDRRRLRKLSGASTQPEGRAGPDGRGRGWPCGGERTRPERLRRRGLGLIARNMVRPRSRFPRAWSASASWWRRASSSPAWIPRPNGSATSCRRPKSSGRAISQFSARPATGEPRTTPRLLGPSDLAPARARGSDFPVDRPQLHRPALSATRPDHLHHVLDAASRGALRRPDSRRMDRLAACRRDRPRLSGVLVVTQPGLSSFHWAMLLSVVGAMAYAAANIMARILVRDDSPSIAFFYVGAVGTAL